MVTYSLPVVVSNFVKKFRKKKKEKRRKGQELAVYSCFSMVFVIKKSRIWLTCNAFFRLYVVSTCNNDACVFLHNFSHYEKSLTLLPLTNVLIFKGIANFPWNLKHLDGRIWWCNRNQTFVNDRLYALVSVASAVHGIRTKYVRMYDVYGKMIPAIGESSVLRSSVLGRKI